VIAGTGLRLPELILASASPRRLALLQQAGLDPDRLLPADIDETPVRGELPRRYVVRMAAEKAHLAATRLNRHGGDTTGFILAADTVVAIGRRILPKCAIKEEAAECLRLLSGRQHRVWTAVSLLTPSRRHRHRLVETRVRFKRLSLQETASYLASGEWRDKAGGYAIQGLAASFVVNLTGSWSSVVGLPVYETVALLDGEGYPVTRMWEKILV
jgi:septum formation protein